MRVNSNQKFTANFLRQGEVEEVGEKIAVLPSFPQHRNVSITLGESLIYVTHQTNLERRNYLKHDFPTLSKKNTSLKPR